MAKINSLRLLAAASAVAVAASILVLLTALQPVQAAFPRLTIEHRERLITGVCPGCWPRADPDPED